MSKESFVYMVSGGNLKQSVVRLEEFKNEDDFNKDEYVQMYGDGVKAKYVSVRSGDFEKIKNAMKSNHQSANMYTGISMVETTKHVKDVVGDCKMHTVKFGDKKDKQVKEAKSKDVKSKDIKSKDTKSKDAKSKDTKSKDAKSKDDKKESKGKKQDSKKKDSDSDDEQESEAESDSKSSVESEQSEAESEASEKPKKKQSGKDKR